MIKPKHLLIATVFILNFQLLIFNSFAQQRPAGGGQMPDLGSLGAVVGMIVDENKQPVQYATVFVTHATDSTTVTGGITDETGRIIITEIPYGTYFLQINAMGYSRHFTPEFTLTQANPRYMLRQFQITQRPQMLQGIEVVTQKEMLQQNLDKKVYNLENSIVTEGATAVEALAEIPSVDVDIEGNVSLRGTGNVTILVDGRPTNLTLEQIPASEIESIEVITNPSARLDPDGMGGVINVMLKKKKQPGFNAFFSGSMATSYFSYNKKYYLDGGNFSANLNYTYNKVTLFLNYNFRSGQWRNAGDLERTTWFQQNPEMPADSTFLNQNNLNRSQFFGNNVRAGIDYFINKQNTLSFSFGYNRMDNKDTSNLTANNLRWLLNEQTPQSFNKYNQDGAGKRYGNNFTGNVNYKKIFDKQGRELTSDLYYTELSGNQKNQYLQQFLMPDSLPDYFQKTNTNSRNRTVTGQVDFVTPVGNGGRIETGYKISYRSISQEYSLFNGSSYHEFRENEQQRNNFKFQEMINAAYFIYSNSFWKVLKVQLGLRGEFANTWSQLLDNKPHYRDYLKLKNILYPTAHIRYDINDYHSLQLSFSRRVTRPNFWSLNPFVDVSDKQNLRMGNPNLGPEFANNLELGYSTSFKSSSLSATLFYRHRTDLITRYTQMRQAYIKDGLIYYTLIDDEIYTMPIEDNFLGTDTFTYTLNSSQNLNKSQSVGLELVYGQRLWKFWRINFSGDCYYVKINSNDLIDPNLSNDWAYGFRLNQTFNLPKSWDLQLNFRFRSRSITTGSMGGMFGGGVGQGRRNAQYSLNLGVKKSFLKNTMSVSLNIRDLIYNPKTTIHSYDYRTTGGYDSNSTRWRSALQMNLTVTYRLNNYNQRREQIREIDTGEAPMGD